MQRQLLRTRWGRSRSRCCWTRQSRRIPLHGRWRSTRIGTARRSGLDPPFRAPARSKSRSSARGRTMGRPVATAAAVGVGLIIFGLLTLYSAGQTDVPTLASRRLSAVHLVRNRHLAATVVFHVLAACSIGSLRGSTRSAFSFCCWCSSGNGSGTARAAELAVHRRPRIGQPSELAKVTAVLVMARYLSAGRNRRDPCGTSGAGDRRRHPVPHHAQAARSGHRYRVRRNLVRHAVLGRRRPRLLLLLACPV